MGMSTYIFMITDIKELPTGHELFFFLLKTKQTFSKLMFASMQEFLLSGWKNVFVTGDKMVWSFTDLFWPQTAAIAVDSFLSEHIKWREVLVRVL